MWEETTSHIHKFLTHSFQMWLKQLLNPNIKSYNTHSIGFCRLPSMRRRITGTRLVSRALLGSLNLWGVFSVQLLHLLLLGIWSLHPGSPMWNSSNNTSLLILWVCLGVFRGSGSHLCNVILRFKYQKMLYSGRTITLLHCSHLLDFWLHICPQHSETEPFWERRDWVFAANKGILFTPS